MDTLERFHETVRDCPTAILATSAGGRVQMRTVSPVLHAGAVLIFTGAASQKYRQLSENPRCCVAVGSFFAEAEAAFCGGTMLSENAALRAAYSEKFPDAFDESAAFGGRNAEFLLLRPTRLSGWDFPDGVPVPDGIPTVPFELILE